MFLLNGKPLAVDMPFTVDGIQYPSNWLRLSSVEEKQAIGIMEVADPVRADDRFYWDGDVNNPKALEDKEEVDAEGKPLYVQVESTDKNGNPIMINGTERLVTKGLKSNFITQVNQTAYSMLLPTDWTVIRKLERSIDIPVDVSTNRLAIIAECSRVISSIKECLTVESLIEVLNSAKWPK